LKAVTYDVVMTVAIAGIYGGSSPGVRRMLREFAQLRASTPRIEGDWMVDLAFCTYDAGERPTYMDWSGIKPGPVGRTQRRFIIWIEVPPDLPDSTADRAWLAGTLNEAARLVREYLPRKSKRYPVDRLADEVLAVRDAVVHNNTVD
jgi:hypothetical protein